MKPNFGLNLMTSAGKGVRSIDVPVQTATAAPVTVLGAKLQTAIDNPVTPKLTVSGTAQASQGVSMADLMDRKIAEAMAPVNQGMSAILAMLQGQQAPVTALGVPSVQTVQRPVVQAQVAQVAPAKEKFDAEGFYNLTAVVVLATLENGKQVTIGVSQGNDERKYAGNIIISGLAGKSLSFTPKTFDLFVQLCGQGSPFSQYWAQVRDGALALAGK